MLKNVNCILIVMYPNRLYQYKLVRKISTLYIFVCYTACFVFYWSEYSSASLGNLLFYYFSFLFLILVCRLYSMFHMSIVYALFAIWHLCLLVCALHYYSLVTPLSALIFFCAFRLCWLFSSLYPFSFGYFKFLRTTAIWNLGFSLTIFV